MTRKLLKTVKFVNRADVFGVCTTSFVRGRVSEFRVSAISTQWKHYRLGKQYAIKTH